MPTKGTLITPTGRTDSSIHEQQQTYEMGIASDLGFVLKHHSQLTDAERYRLLTSDGPKNVTLLDIFRQIRHKFLKTWLEDDRFSSWLVYTQLSSGGGLCKICIVMQARLKHGNIGNAAFVKKPSIALRNLLRRLLTTEMLVITKKQLAYCCEKLCQKFGKWPKCVCKLGDSICYTNERKQKHN